MTITSNATLKEMGTILAGAKSVLLFPHINPDPDAIGTGMALCRALRQQGITAWVLVDGPLPDYLQFLLTRKAARVRADSRIAQDFYDKDIIEGAAADPGLDPDGITITYDPSVLESPDISLCIDCSDETRFAGREEAFYAGRIKCCIDHHMGASTMYDHYYIDSDAAACAQIVYHMIREMEWPITRLMAEELYTGINGDTGCFMHSNTTPEIHRIAADLMEHDFDINEIHVSLYQSKSPEEIRVQAKALSSIDLLADGKALMAKMTKEDFEACGADTEASENVIDALRVMRGVEIAAFLKEDGDLVRVSMRSKTTANVAEIAKRFGGGGHVKAAGFRTTLPMDEVYDRLRESIISAVEKA